ncbi:hypothetical protein ABZY10_02855 [Streptomyces sp. NPDC006539]|uniref:hypothetical protein n=1 Tax=Streptomyces sp. NPDC006539 TaxID=3155352 RepID=UPI0033B318A4
MRLGPRPAAHGPPHHLLTRTRAAHPSRWAVRPTREDTHDHKTEPDRERSEFESAEAMTALLVALGVQAETINTGGNCWSSSISPNR